MDNKRDNFPYNKKRNKTTLREVGITNSKLLTLLKTKNLKI